MPCIGTRFSLLLLTAIIQRHKDLSRDFGFLSVAFPVRKGGEIFRYTTYYSGAK